MRPYLLLALYLSLTACTPDAVEPDTYYTFIQPEHFPPATYDFERNPVTEAGFELGKRLFNELRLSRDNSISCADCHQQSVAFADPQHRLSLGVEDRSGTRNAPGLFNLAFTREFMLDGGIAHLDFVPINAITSKVEMDETLENVVAKLSADAGYRAGFQEAFGFDTITSGLLFQALSQYQLMLVSATSKYDDVVLNRNGASFTSAEQRGFDLFKANCASCHAGPLFTDQGYRNNGLDSERELDLGRSLITESVADRGKFRVPTLRNISRTPPYMHDGRFNTLREVMDHYRSGIQRSNSLDPRLVDGINLEDGEVEDLLSFLATLTDWEFIQDARF